MLSEVWQSAKPLKMITFKEMLRTMFSEIDVVIYQVVADWKDRTGLKLRHLAHELGINPNSLRRKVNRDKTTHCPARFSVAERARLYAVTGDERLVPFLPREAANDYALAEAA
ncbi:hypothetical protein KIF53_15465 [Chromobacterium subtsugae]|uniref:Uncharacterized protein n=2 Tax=Chromobacterium subtsugae TaxID=251747 RepID=A0ABS7FGA8_9NEIS|nr:MULTISPECIES: phage regulatory CII family protein [Chromobacterium]MBW7567804.1 hypothetical protein [Chromobacterium subtsugae]MBW8289031.1 hypothetical protein [Chromobacterium subtsugae]WSE93825.1 phage regulatory CII family protein [Chromobacterium subtsugae]WVH62202.1 phage regulatory CII family protein [Chromobacterium subtsugae]